MINLLWTEYESVFNGQPEANVKYQCPGESWVNKLRYYTNLNSKIIILLRWSMRPLLREQSDEYINDPDRKYCLVSDGTTTNKDNSSLMGVGVLDQVSIQIFTLIPQLCEMTSTINYLFRQ